MPPNEFTKSAMRYTGKFNVKFKVQTRQARVSHVDSHYVAAQYKYLKEFCVMKKEEVLFVCMDDKAIVPVGEPHVMISTGVRGHNKVLAPASGASFTCTDHDFHIAGVVPSVSLVTNIPESPQDSFFGGKVFVTLKDKVFEPSSPFRHAAEILRILRANFSEDNVDLSKPILAIKTDGGPDHRVTFYTVQAALVVVFMQLDLDMLIAIRTAPNHSWCNPAERCMSILNLALQHTALARQEMPDNFEKKIKNKSSMAAVRNVAECDPELKNAFSESMNPVLDLLSERFSRMKLKGEQFKVYRGASSEKIAEELQIIRDAFCRTDGEREKVKATASSKEIREIKTLQV